MILKDAEKPPSAAAESRPQPEAVQQIRQHLHLDELLTRLQAVSEIKKAIRPPEIENWLQITDAELERLWLFLQLVYRKLSDSGSEEAKAALNVDKDSFSTHLGIMETFIDVIVQTPGFKEFSAELEQKKLAINRNFLVALALVHDVGRLVFNGQYSLSLTDGLSEVILRKILPKFPKVWLHSMNWITEQVTPPDMKDGQYLEPQAIQPEHKVGLLLKTVDTLSKLDPQGKLIRLNTFYEPNQAYERWIEKQKQNRRLPMRLHNGVAIDAVTYAENDTRLTKSGAAVIEIITGLPFAELQDMVEAAWNNRNQEHSRQLP